MEIENLDFNLDENKKLYLNKFKNLLKKLDRNNSLNLIDKFKRLDFFKCPTSIYYHKNLKNNDYGLMIHSVLVCEVALYMNNFIKVLKGIEFEEQDIIKTCLFHDLNKLMLYSYDYEKNSWVYKPKIILGDEYGLIYLKQFGLEINNYVYYGIKYHNSVSCEFIELVKSKNFKFLTNKEKIFLQIIQFSDFFVTNLDF